jgi:ATP-dependent Clp protease protease subunit
MSHEEQLEEGRTIVLSDDIDCNSVSSVIERIIQINEADRSRQARFRFAGEAPPIRLVINSFGGSVHAGLALIGAIEASETPIETVVLGSAMSMGLLIAISGHHRVCHRYATYMYHEVAKWSGGKLEELKLEMEEMTRLQTLLEEHILQRTKITKEKLEDFNKTRKDWYFTAEEAMELGLADEMILGPEAEDERRPGIREDI